MRHSLLYCTRFWAVKILHIQNIKFWYFQIIHCGYLCDSFESCAFSPSVPEALLQALEILTLITSLITQAVQWWPVSRLWPPPPTTLLQIKPACAGTYTYIQCTPCSRLSASLSPMVLLLWSRVLVIRCQQVFVCSSVPEHKGGYILDNTHTTPHFHYIFHSFSATFDFHHITTFFLFFIMSTL